MARGDSGWNTSTGSSTSTSKASGGKSKGEKSGQHKVDRFEKAGVQGLSPPPPARPVTPSQLPARF
jgi:hypothetical protein